MKLKTYKAKRDFRKTPEPRQNGRHKKGEPIFVVQEHHASHLHYDFRLEADGVLKSWAVPKGPSMKPGERRLAVHVEDHPLGYASFEGKIPEGQYGAGEVLIWDRGTFETLPAKGKPRTVTEGIDAGKFDFALHGNKLRGSFALVRLKTKNGGKDNWLLIKKRDDTAPAQQLSPGLSRNGRPNPPAVDKLEFTNSSKLMYPDDGITKGDVIQFYAKISEYLLPHLRDRPATLERFPDGIGAGTPRFWQKNTPDYVPEWIQRINLPSDEGKPVNYALVNNVQTLLYLVNLGTLTFHVWMSRVHNLDRPDYVLFDLDPGEAQFADVVTVAKSLHATLRDKKPLLKTSGKSGLHILVPWREKGDHDAARAWALELAEEVAGSMPRVATTERSKAKRQGRVYIDTGQNGLARHVVPPYVLRPLPGAIVSTPLQWRELTDRLSPSQFNWKTIFPRLDRQKRDLLAPLLESR